MHYKKYTRNDCEGTAENKQEIYYIFLPSLQALDRIHQNDIKVNL